MCKMKYKNVYTTAKHCQADYSLAPRKQMICEKFTIDKFQPIKIMKL